MASISRLAANWRRWAPSLGGGPIAILPGKENFETTFKSDDFTVYLREDGPWWVVDTVDDRGQRRDGAAKLSSFDLAEKYLIWDWATTARSDLASGELGANLAQLGYAPGVDVSEVDRGYKVCVNGECAILSSVNAIIFSHLMTRPVEEIERLTLVAS